ncbi:pilus assembly protein [Brevundimonas naejangsanensis]|uniref:Pilus assembly protein n=1 Tax=Brevundimonas naejangsanensis TaxID=588932 RepID=A0A494RIF9_9CAUL|nr:TadE/TadG family type IV pilus assembly protein [Brevundimonas naejangsanensis]AYG94250.1 pilus assembly protein [Brevundimonas naejangsanensis]
MDRLKHAQEAVSARLKGLVSRLLRRTEGNVAMMFGLALPLLVMITLGGIDIHQASKVKANLQDALDAAALAAARSTFTDDVNINRIGLAALKANMPGYFAEDSQDTASFVLADNRVTGDARVNVKVLVANIVLPPYGKLLDDYLPVSSRSEVLRASRNVEVAMVLDTTGSMAGTRISDLRAAAMELVDIVVQQQQTPFYSRVALAPYDWAVKLDASTTLPGTLAKAARGDLRRPTGITDVRYFDSSGSVSSVSRAKPAVVTTSTNHGLKTGDRVAIAGVSNTTNINDNAHTVTVVDAKTFSLDGSDTRSYSKNGSSGTFAKCLRADCKLIVTSARHGLTDNDYVYIDGTSGLKRRTNSVPHINGNFVPIEILDVDRFVIDRFGPNYDAYGNSGQAYCTVRGCEYFVFKNSAGSMSILPATNCVSERTGAEAYTDVSPVTAPVGRVYSTGCNSQPILPLTSVRSDLENRIGALQASGNTAGQIGIGWGWYLVSPTFGSIFTGDGRPAPYDTSETLKAVVLMTDGEFNAPYCQDVAANTGGSSTSRIYCTATNGSPFQQSVKMCEGMKAQNIVVYTVGFGLGSNRGGSGVDTAIEVMETCATNKDTHFFKADSGTDLREAFKAIGRDITRLRIAR